MKVLRSWVLGLAAIRVVTAAAFDDVPVGARPAALGQSFVSVADDANTLYYNPAGLASLYRPEITAYYSRPFAELSDQSQPAFIFSAVALPLPQDGRWGGLGLGYQEFRVDDLYKETTLTLGYGHTLLSDRLALGAGLKQMSRRFGSNADTDNAFVGTNPSDRTGGGDPVFGGGRSKSALGVDVGGIYALTSRWRVGASLANVNQPDVGLSEKHIVPLLARMGVTYDKTYVRLTGGWSVRRPEGLGADQRFQLGGERQWSFRRLGLLSLRGGGELGSRDFRRASLGAGYEVNGLGLDYVLTIPMGAAQDTGNTHNMSLSYRFGKSISEDDLADQLEEERAANERAQSALKTAEEEAAYVKEERNRLLNEYASEVERLKAQVEQARQEASPTIVVPAHRLTAAERERQARAKALHEFTNAYQSAMRGYGDLVSRGATLVERADFLKSTLVKYVDKKVDVSQCRRERTAVQEELARVLADYQITMDFYRKTVGRGADAAERMSLLERIQKRYAPSGIDLKEVRNEMAEVKRISKGGPR